MTDNERAIEDFRNALKNQYTIRMNNLLICVDDDLKLMNLEPRPNRLLNTYLVVNIFLWAAISICLFCKGYFNG